MEGDHEIAGGWWCSRSASDDKSMRNVCNVMAKDLVILKFSFLSADSNLRKFTWAMTIVGIAFDR